MNVELTQQEATLVLDALAYLPLAKSYALFQKIAAIYQTEFPAGPPQPETKGE